MNKIIEKGIEFYRVPNDTYGNPRYVVHFLHFADDFNEALRRARSIMGKKYRGKWFGGGIVVQSYEPRITADRIIELRDTQDI